MQKNGTELFMERCKSLFSKIIFCASIFKPTQTNNTLHCGCCVPRCCTFTSSVRGPGRISSLHSWAGCESTQCQQVLQPTLINNALLLCSTSQIWANPASALGVEVSEHQWSHVTEADGVNEGRSPIWLKGSALLLAVWPACQMTNTPPVCIPVWLQSIIGATGIKQQKRTQFQGVYIISLVLYLANNHYLQQVLCDWGSIEFALSFRAGKVPGCQHHEALGNELLRGSGVTGRFT